VSGPERDQEIRRMARQVLGELIGSGNGNGSPHGNGNGTAHGPVPQVPAPPVAAVLRPSTWNRPPAPGEIIGQPGPAAPAPAPAPARPQPSPALPPRAATAPAPAPPPPADTPRAQTAITNPGADARVEAVTIESDDDLMQFVRQLIARVTNPRDRLAIHTGKLRFTLRRRAGSPAAAGTAGGAAPAGPVTRIAKGAVTERVIRDAADAGTRLVLAPGTVLTPLARERAQALGVEIERERK
jgi:hypothetical protein